MDSQKEITDADYRPLPKLEPIEWPDGLTSLLNHAKQIAEKVPTVSITIEVPLKDIDLDGCTCTRHVERHPYGDGTAAETLYDVDLGDALFMGYPIDDMPAATEEAITQRLIEERYP